MSWLRYLGNWLICWDRPWAARDAMLGSICGQFFCPCGNCKGKRLPKRAQAIIDAQGISHDENGTFFWQASADRREAEQARREKGAA